MIRLFTLWQHIGSLLLLVSFGSACSRSSGDNLLLYPNARFIVDTEGRDQPPTSYAPNWQNFDREKLENLPHRPGTKVWIAIPLPPDRAYLVNNACQNLEDMYLDNRRVLFHVEMLANSQNQAKIIRTPILHLPEIQTASTLLIQTNHSPRVGYLIDCQQLEILGREDAIRSLLNSEASNLIVGFITLFLGLASLIFFLFKPQSVILYFSVFACSMAGTYLLGSTVIRFNSDNLQILNILWHLSITLAPIPFLLFFNEVMRPPRNLTRWLAILNAGLYFLMIGLKIFVPSLTFAEMRTYYLPFIAIQLILIPPLAVIGIIRKRLFAGRFAAGVSILALATIHDINILLYGVNAKGDFLLPWVLIGFLCLLLFIVLQTALNRASSLEKQASQMLIDRNRSLLTEVELRTADLNRKSQDLERLHRELAERHELLAVQRRNLTELVEEKDLLVSQIYTIAQQTVPSILHQMQKLHHHSDPEELRTLEGYVQELHLGLDKVAKLYIQRIHIRNRRVVLLDPDKKNQRSYKLALGGSKMELTLVSSSNELWSQLDLQTFDLIGVHQEFFDVIHAVRSRQKESPVLLLSAASDDDNLKFLVDTRGPLQVVPLNLPRGLLQKILLIHATKLVSKDIFGLEKYLVWGSVVKEHSLSEHKSRQSLVDAVRQDLENQGLEAKAVQRLGELCYCLMDLTTSSALMKPSRTSTHTPALQQMRYGYDANFWILSIELQGSLLPREPLLNLLASYRDGPASEIPGLIRLFELADALTLNTDGQSHHELLAIVHPEFEHRSQQTAAFYYFSTASNNDLV